MVLPFFGGSRKGREERKGKKERRELKVERHKLKVERRESKVEREGFIRYGLCAMFFLLYGSLLLTPDF